MTSISERTVAKLPRPPVRGEGAAEIHFTGHTHLRKNTVIVEQPVPEVIKRVTCSTQLSMNFQLLIQTNLRNNKEFLDSQMFNLSCQ